MVLMGPGSTPLSCPTPGWDGLRPELLSLCCASEPPRDLVKMQFLVLEVWAVLLPLVHRLYFE